MKQKRHYYKQPFPGYSKTMNKWSAERWLEKKKAEKAKAKGKYAEERWAGEHITHFGRNKEAMNIITSIANKLKPKNRPLIINNIGCAATEIGKKGKMMTYEPFEIVNQLSKSGKDFRVYSFTTSSEKAKELSKIKTLEIDMEGPHRNKSEENVKYLKEFPFKKPVLIKEKRTVMRTDANSDSIKISQKNRVTKAKVTVPEEIREKMKFGEIDIVTATPVKRADITFSLNIDSYLPGKSTQVALANMAQSTRKGGYVITDLPAKEKELKGMGLKIVKEMNKSGKPPFIVYKKVN